MQEVNTASRMDQQYRYQRYIYDFSRKFYLLGRDTLLKELRLPIDETLLEVGCGTARNLSKLAYRYPTAQLFGVDASTLMLECAQKSLQNSPYQASITLRQGLAEQVHWQDFGLDAPWDHVLFSYVLSMLPDWKQALEHALTQLKPQGYLHIVDFSDQAQMPAWFRHSLIQWLAWFNVHPQVQILEHLEYLAVKHNANLQIKYLAGRYAFIAHYRKRQPVSAQAKLPDLATYLDI
ncbi:class I SAM-dependent methyltransferase [uncultured Thiothrix sp.]|uniref:class I SAM-dependent methyltransferase n=1 Tax=uncultured Thiothrix sp. TaxID=223185 RepID=UPI002621F791|nr:class I SAM-dependent methyltransferase [uncultured Thiothrix sp.]